MRGVNRRPLPAGAVTDRPNGGLTVKTPGGGEYAVRANGTLKTYSSGAQTVNFRSNGRLAAIHRPEMDIRRDAAGQRTIVSRRPDRSVLVGTAPHRGYLERTVVVGNRTVIQRTYVAGGRTFTRAYWAMGTPGWRFRTTFRHSITRRRSTVGRITVGAHQFLTRGGGRRPHGTGTTAAI